MNLEKNVNFEQKCEFEKNVNSGKKIEFGKMCEFGKKCVNLEKWETITYRGKIWNRIGIKDVQSQKLHFVTSTLLEKSPVISVH